MDRIFDIKNDSDFNALALEIFYFQSAKNPIYGNYLKHLSINPKRVKEVLEIPFLPVEFFKQDFTENKTGGRLFLSSGTTGMLRSKHYVEDISIYEKSFLKGFNHFYGDIRDYCLIALLPSYVENEHSSLIYMVNELIKRSNNEKSGFYHPQKKGEQYKGLIKKLKSLDETRQKTIVIGVSYALLDFAQSLEKNSFSDNIIFMETGGMKGRGREMVRGELHEQLCMAFGVKEIHSEYGMTELLSQAYSKGKGIFNCPPWMKIVIRDTNDPFNFLDPGLTGGINIIDLANINSCSFIATQDLGKKNEDVSFEVLGRFDSSEIRGCNLML